MSWRLLPPDLSHGYGLPQLTLTLRNVLSLPPTILPPRRRLQKSKMPRGSPWTDAEDFDLIMGMTALVEPNLMFRRL